MLNRERLNIYIKKTLNFISHFKMQIKTRIHPLVRLAKMKHLDSLGQETGCQGSLGVKKLTLQMLWVRMEIGTDLSEVNLLTSTQS